MSKRSTRTWERGAGPKAGESGLHGPLGSIRDGCRGTASVEMIAAVPVILLALAVSAQIAIAGYALWSAGLAARAGARAELVGSDVDGAVKRALPSVLRDGVKVKSGDSIRVGVTVPHLLPLLPDTFVYGSGSLGSG